MGQSQLTVNNLNANPVLVTVKNMSRRRFSVDSFAGIRSANKLDLLYNVTSPIRDYSVESWGDKEYSIHLQSLLNEQEWLQFKRDIFQIYADQNAKKEALRILIEFNWYRSINAMYLILVGKFLSYLPQCCYRDPLRDKTLLQNFLLCPLYLLCFPLCYIIMIFAVVFILLDLITGLRFFVFQQPHMAFLESVMVAHPELDPTVVEEELVQKIQQLLDTLSRHHPEVHCKLSTSTVHHRRNGSNASFDADVFEIQFFKFALEKEP